MSELEKLRLEHEEKVKALQNSCPHAKKAPWETETYRSMNIVYCVRSCLRCGKQVTRSLVADISLPDRPFSALPFEIRSKIRYLSSDEGIDLEEARKKHFEKERKT